MKTGLLTFYHIHHYGAMLQAYATERAVASLGSECEIIDYYVNQDNTLFQRPTGLGSAAHDAHTALHYGPLKARYERFEAFSRENLNISGRRYQSLEELRQELHQTNQALRNAYDKFNFVTAPELVEQMGFLADRLSVNIELPSQEGLQTLAPDKNKQAILRPMALIRDRTAQSKAELVQYKHAPVFAPAGQSTQLIVGATRDTDRHILHLTESLYQKYRLKRVFYSAYVPVVENALLPSLDTKPPLLREHRLYQADWLLRFYGFRAEELLDEQTPSFDDRLDPKCCWALRHPEFFPVEVNRADYEALLRVPGLGVVSARRILTARRTGPLQLENLPKLGVVMKRAQYFLTANGRMADGLRFTQDSLLRNLIAVEQSLLPQPEMRQLSLFDDAV